MKPPEDSTIPKSFWKVHFRLLEQGLLLETDPTSDRYLLLMGLEDHHAEAIDHVLGNHSLAVAATYIARLLERHKWIAYIGLVIVGYVAVDMIWRGTDEIRALVLAFAQGA